MPSSVVEYFKSLGLVLLGLGMVVGLMCLAALVAVSTGGGFAVGLLSFIALFLLIFMPAAIWLQELL